MRRTRALIAGGGPAGSAAAIGLAQSGVRPLIVEKTRETGDALCGGFLSWATLRNLARLGIENLGGHPIGQLRLFAQDRYAAAPLPAGAIGVSRRHLDTAMLDHAILSGAAVERGVVVREIVANILRMGDGGEIEGDALFVATGKHDVRGLGRAYETDDPTLGLRVAIPPHPSLDRLIGGAIELHLFDRGYAGLVLQEDGHANLCLAVRKSRFAEVGGRPEALLADWGAHSPLGARLAFMTPQPQIDAVAAVPYGWRTRETVAGRFRLGDQAAVIPSLAGEGMGIAIASGIAAARAWQTGGADAAQSFQRDFALRTRRPVGVASALWHLCERPAAARFGTATLAVLPALAGLVARATRIGD